MFYEVTAAEPAPSSKQISAMVVLNPAESRRLLAKTAVALPEVRNAWKNGMIIIARASPLPLLPRNSSTSRLSPRLDRPSA